MKLIKMRGKQPVGKRDDWNFDLELGDKVVDAHGSVWRLVNSSGWGKRNLGELTPRFVKPPVPGAIAVFDGGLWYWRVDND